MWRLPDRRARTPGGIRAILLALSLIPPFLFAAESPTHALAQTSSGGGNYRLESKDVVKIDVQGRSDISGQYTIGLDGSIVLPVVGSVKAAGRTTAELASDLSRRISLVQRESPKVTVTLVESPTQKVSVLGQVMFPGAYSLPGDATLWDAIAEAGGPQYMADLGAVELVSDSLGVPMSQVVDLASAIRDGQLESLPHPKPGDTVRVPSRTVVGGAYGVPEAGPPGGAPVAGAGAPVYVFGAVRMQGAQPLEQSPNLVRAIITSQPAENANLSKVQLVRLAGPGVVRFNLDVKKAYLGKADLNGNPPLQAGDTIYVPPSPRTNWLAAVGVISSLLAITTSVLAITNNN
jgi:polysaccharide export outer membrane protein